MGVAGDGRMRVLVIDDNADLCANLRAGLEIEGYEVLTASNGEQGLKQLAEHKVDAVVTDLFMPDKDGIETIVALKERFPGLGIIAMSGRLGATYLPVAQEIGASTVLNKPFSLAELIAALRRLESPNP
jgi:DNA-binding response OmpR family regulator